MKEKQINGMILGKAFPLLVNYVHSTEEMVAIGKYNQINSGVNNQNFPTPPELIGKTVTLLARLAHFEEERTTQQVEEMVRKHGYRSGTSTEILSYRIYQPERSQVCFTAALGSKLEDKGDSFVVVICPGKNNHSKLDLNSCNLPWGIGSFFLIIKEGEVEMKATVRKTKELNYRV